ncbi:MAG TPA: TetR/AcrR family transcriptional regulator [Deltaproteobacteria bacterium]|nr:TetR/AcrR family transcriptional regulator [Deltaproteobacteria bacterium]HPR53488.1 TetR/AcrR family transcriptional regulator [Deltaproteobacteria bacterium]HXK46175.1 TetR/AcrR family transcriptional regulator [Deltaproteobacteria bacterium]
MRIRIPKQNRSRERKQRIMDTALALFAQKGMKGTSSNEIAGNAGVSIGTFYSYFENKKSLFLEILEEHLDNFVTGIYTLQRDDSITMRENIRGHIVKAFAVFDLHTSFHKEALVMKFTDPDVRRLFEEVEKKQLVIISTLLEYYRTGSTPRDLEAMAKVIHSAVENVAHYVKFLESPFEKERLIEELTEMICRYVESI